MSLEEIGTQQQGAIDQTFSIIVPVSAHREELAPRTFRSLLNQTYPADLYEVQIVIDGGRDVEKDVMEEEIKSYNDPRLNIAAIHDGRFERCISRNDGMRAATKDWICWLDSDDEYMTCYLDRMNWAINEYPDHKVFNFGAIVCREGGHSLRQPFDLKGELYEEFQGGMIGAGSFIFKRELLDDPDVGYLPEVMNCYALADAAGIPGYNAADRTLGNPWGDDAYMFYKIAKKYVSKKLDFFPYINYIRRSYNAPHYPTNK